MDSILQVSDLKYSMDHSLHAKGQDVLRGLNLNVRRGERIGVIGPNGAGKTTLFLLICGIKKPLSGQIMLFSKPVVQGEFRAELGLVMQNQDDQIFCPSVWDDIAFGPVNMGFSHDEVESRVQEAMDFLNIVHLKDRPPHELSGGEKRLVAIAGIMAMKPKFVIYDEPTSNLDMRYRRRLIRFLHTCSFQEGMMVASHDLEFILEVCNRVILIDEGTIVADGKPRELLADETLMHKHGLECPYSLLLERTAVFR